MAEETPKQGEDRPPAPTAKKSTAYTFEALRVNARALGLQPYELAGAARYHGWTDDTALTKAQLQKGVEDWLKSPALTTTEEA